MLRVDVRDLAGGAILVALGLFFALYAAAHYRLGTPAQMGTGFLPFWLGCILTGFGVCIMAMSVSRQTKVHVLTPPPIRWRSAIAVLAAILIFHQLIESAGLIPAAFVLTVVAAVAEREFHPVRTAMLGLALGVLSWLIFTVSLQMRLPAFVFWG